MLATYIHEIGHALGLGHPGQYSGFWGGSFLLSREFDLDSSQLSVMSYFYPWNFPLTIPNPAENIFVAGDFFRVATPMMADIKAVEILYGKVVANIGDTKYEMYSENQGYTITDRGVSSDGQVNHEAGGEDWILRNLSTYAERIDLREGHGSDINGLTNSLFIGHGSIIENVLAGGGDTTIIGNEVRNILFGGGGNDTIHGNGGDDEIRGGSGNNTLSGGDGEDTVSYVHVLETYQSTCESHLGILFSSGTVRHAEAGDTFTDTLDTFEIIEGSSLDDGFNLDASIETYKGMFGDDAFWMSAPGSYRIDGGEETRVGEQDQLVIVGGQSNLAFNLSRDASGFESVETVASGDMPWVVNGKGIELIQGGDLREIFRFQDATAMEIHGGDGDPSIHDRVEIRLNEGFVGGEEDIILYQGGVLTFQVNGEQATLVGIEEISAGIGDDIIYSNGLRRAEGGGGDDTFFQVGGQATVFDGGSDINTLSYREVGTQFTRPDGEWGVHGTAGALRHGNGSVSFLDTYQNIQILHLSRFRDHIEGSASDETIYGLAGDDHLYGMGGDDVLVGGAGDDVLNGGGGNFDIDTASYVDAVTGITTTLTHSLANGYASGTTTKDGSKFFGTQGQDTLIDIEKIAGSNHADTITIDGALSGSLFADGGHGNDTLEAKGNGGKLYGGWGDDTLTAFGLGAIGTTTYLYGGQGNDTIDTLGVYSITGIIDGGADHDIIKAHMGKFTIYGGSGNDFIKAGSKSTLATEVWGGSGRDVFLVDRSTIINDFDPTQDFISFNNSFYTTAFSFSQSGGDVVVTRPGGLVVRIKDTLVSDLKGSGTGQNWARESEALSTNRYNQIRDAAPIVIDTEATTPDMVLSGQSGNDRLLALSGTNFLYGNAGNDTLIGGTGDDHLFGGAGIDVMTGGEGDDVLDGGAGNDEMTGGAGRDTFRMAGAFGADTIADFEEGDTVFVDFAGGLSFNMMTIDQTGTRLSFFGGSSPSIMLAGVSLVDADLKSGTGGMTISMLPRTPGTEGDDVLVGTSGDDVLLGGDGNDTLDGGAGNDVLSGGAGDDVLIVSAGEDILDGGDGFDTADFSTLTGRLSISHDTYYHFDPVAFEPGSIELRNIERLIATAWDDQVYLSGFTGPVRAVDGGEGDDWIRGSNESDTILGGAGHDAIFAEDPVSLFMSPPSAGGDILDGGEGHDWIVGSRSADTIFGGAGRDMIFGGQGDDILSGGADADMFLFGPNDGFDVITDFDIAQDWIEITIDYTIGELWNVETITSVLTDGSLRDDTFLSIGSYDYFADDFVITQTLLLEGVVVGWEDLQMISYPWEAKNVYGTTENPYGYFAWWGIGTQPGAINGSEGDDVLVGTYGSDVINGFGGSDYIQTRGGFDIVDAGAGDDVIEVNGALSGVAGHTTLTGGEGADVFLFSKHFESATITDFDPLIDTLAVYFLDNYGMFQGDTGTQIAFYEQDMMTGQQSYSILTLEGVFLEYEDMITQHWSTIIGQPSANLKPIIEMAYY
jgi:Ca2+-binding RTX toxin-like protein